MARRWPDAVRPYLKASLKLADKAAGSLEALKRADCPESAMDGIVRLVAHVCRFADQIERRALRGKTIPHGEQATLLPLLSLVRPLKYRIRATREISESI